MAGQPEFIDASDVKNIIESKEPGVTIIDVRADDEFADGHIAGALHVPSGKFQDEAEVDKVIENLPTNGTVVVHCMLSQVRGPKCANRIAERLQSEAWADRPDKPTVKVLRHGFEGFFNQFGGEKPELFENVKEGS